MTIVRLLDRTESPPEPADLYTSLAFPAAPHDRPIVFINMVATVDGKIVIGAVGGTAAGVGGPTDQVLFRRIQRAADAALIGASTLRAGPVIYPESLPRFVVTAGGRLPLSNRFFVDAPDRAYVLAPDSIPAAAGHAIREAAHLHTFGADAVDMSAALDWMRRTLGIERLLCEGGATLNSVLLHGGLVDEFFLTVTPKLKGGANLPTPVGGEGLPAGVAVPLALISAYLDNQELYLRYRITSVA